MDHNLVCIHTGETVQRLTETKFEEKLYICNLLNFLVDTGRKENNQTKENATVDV